MYRIQNKAHSKGTYKIDKISSFWYNNKNYILEDGIPKVNTFSWIYSLIIQKKMYINYFNFRLR